MKINLFKTYSNEEIAQLIYDEFVSDTTLTENNVRKKFESFEELFWSRHQVEELLQIPELENRQWEIFDIVWFKIIEFERELVLKRNKVLNTKTNEELAEMLYVKVKKQVDLSSINLHMYYRDIGIEDFLSLSISSKHGIFDYSTIVTPIFLKCSNMDILFESKNLLPLKSNFLSDVSEPIDAGSFVNKL